MVLLVPQALAAYFPVIPVAEHINIFYTLLAVIFVFVLGYMFVYNKRH